MSLDIFGDKWTVEVLICAFLRVRSFAGFERHTGIASNILAARLVRLVNLGLLRKHAGDSPGRDGSYALTDKGIDCYPILIALQAWADFWVEDRYHSPVQLIHRRCARALISRLVCERCGSVIDRDGSRLHRA